MRWKRFSSALVASVLLALLVLPASAAVTIAMRELPTSVASGAEFEITITPSGCGIFGQVWETLPAGFIYLSCTPSDIAVEKAGNSIGFTFAGSESFAYRVEAPVVTTTSYTFHGIVKDENKVEYLIQDSVITVIAPAPATYRLTILLHGNGSTSPSSLINHTYDAGTEVNISATPAAGWQFDSWSGDVANPLSPLTTVTMEEDKTIVASFSGVTLPVYTLTLICKPSEGGDVILMPPASANQYGANTSVTLTAAPAESYAFSGWGGDSSGSGDTITIVMDSGKTVIANFSPLDKSTSFIVSSLSVLPEKVKPKQTVHILVSIANSGEKAENYQAPLYINGRLEDARIVEIPAYSSKNMVFNVTRSIPGTYTVSIGDKQGKFTVDGKESLFNKLGIVTTVAIVVIAALVAALVLTLRKIKKRA